VGGPCFFVFGRPLFSGLAFVYRNSSIRHVVCLFVGRAPDANCGESIISITFHKTIHFNMFATFYLTVIVFYLSCS
jgi:hypothetical protein